MSSLVIWRDDPVKVEASWLKHGGYEAVEYRPSDKAPSLSVPVWRKSLPSESEAIRTARTRSAQRRKEKGLGPMPSHPNPSAPFPEDPPHGSDALRLIRDVRDVLLEVFEVERSAANDVKPLIPEREAGYVYGHAGGAHATIKTPMRNLDRSFIDTLPDRLMVGHANDDPEDGTAEMYLNVSAIERHWGEETLDLKVSVIPVFAIPASMHKGEAFDSFGHAIANDTIPLGSPRLRERMRGFLDEAERTLRSISHRPEDSNMCLK